MRKKVQNVLRMCQAHGHDQVIVSLKFDGLPARQVAALFREALQEDSSDTCGAFSRVTFALPSNRVTARVFMAFQEEFNPESLHRSSWKQGRFLAPTGVDN